MSESHAAVGAVAAAANTMVSCDNHRVAAAVIDVVKPLADGASMIQYDMVRYRSLTWTEKLSVVSLI